MAKRKGSLPPALVAAPPTTIIINAGRAYNPANPHSWMPLIADASDDGAGTRVMWGVLRASYQGHANSASAFVAAKLQPSWSADPQAVTAAWCETLAPPDADDSFGDAVLLAARIDREIARDAERKIPLFGYATITDPNACRIHAFREELRGVARELVDAYGTAVVAVVHAPGRAGSRNPLHGHLAISCHGIDGPLGFSARIAALSDNNGREIILDLWRGRRRFV